jgi:hypothetical protein
MSGKGQNGSATAAAAQYRKNYFSAKESFFDRMNQVVKVKLIFSASC